MYEMNYKFDFRGDCTDKDLIWYIGSTLFFYDYISDDDQVYYHTDSYADRFIVNYKKDVHKYQKTDTYYTTLTISFCFDDDYQSIDHTDPLYLTHLIMRNLHSDLTHHYRELA